MISLANYQVNFNYKDIKYAQLDEEGLKKDCIDYLQKQPGVAFAVDMKKAETAAIPEELRTRIVNGYSPVRSGAIQIILLAG